MWTFVARHDGKVPDNWLVLDSIDNHTLDLGRWSYRSQALVVINENKAGDQAKRKGWIGVALASAAPLGVRIIGVTDQGPAKNAGIIAGDIVVKFDGQQVVEAQELSRMVATEPIGRATEVVVSRAGKEISLTVTVGENDTHDQPNTAKPQRTLNIDEKLGTAEGWSIGLSNRFGGCLASMTYQDQTTLWLGLRDGEKRTVFLAFTNPNWKSIEPGKEYQIQIVAVQGGKWHGPFVGIGQAEGEKGVIEGDLKEAFVNALVRSPGIAVSFGQRAVAKLRLDGSPAALAALVECQNEHGKRAANRGGGPDSKHDGPSSGTGFFITTEGHIFTNNHVVEDCSNVQVQKPGGLQYEARVLAHDAQNDLALVLSAMKPLATAAFRSEIRLGESIGVFGFPLTGLLATSGNFTAGYVSALAGLRDDTGEFQMSAQVQPGNSGGPVLDQSGNVVGVVVAMLNSSKMLAAADIVPQNVNFAIKSTTAINFLRANNIKVSEEQESARLDLADVAEKARAMTVQILCPAR
jgi:serine protease Do